jgi:hypothetical protein
MSNSPFGAPRFAMNSGEWLAPSMNTTEAKPLGTKPANIDAAYT